MHAHNHFTHMNERMHDRANALAKRMHAHTQNANSNTTQWFLQSLNTHQHSAISALVLGVQDRCARHLVDHALDPTSSAEVQCQLLAQLHLGECSTLRSRESQNKGWQYGKSKRASEQASKHARKRANAAHRTRRARSAGISTTRSWRTVSTAQ